MKATLGIDEADTSRDAQITFALNVATDAIDRVCRRHFYDPATVVNTSQTYQAPIGSDLFVDEFVSVTSVQLQYGNGTPQTLTTAQYETLPYNIQQGSQPSYNILRRVAGGWPIPWLGDGEGGIKVLVTADWLFSATSVPYPIQAACRMYAARLFQREVGAYADASGVSAGGMQFPVMPLTSKDGDVREFLMSYKALRMA